jgi:glyoxylase-like metal-dependent hydrolase (beta-lactamase superfamily II)
MLRKLSAGCVAVICVVWILSAQSELQTVVDHSMKAMGVENVRTMMITGEGGDGFVGQNLNPHADHWRWYKDRESVQWVDFESRGWRIQRIHGEGENPPGGGAGTTTPAPDVPQTQVVIVGNNFNNQIEFSLMPLGFLKMALENRATVKSEMVKGKKYTVLTFPIENTAPAGGYKTSISGWIDEQGYVERVAALVDNNVLGDITWDAVYTDWKDFGKGLMFPAHMVQNQGGKKYFELNVTDVKPTVYVDLTAPQAKGGGKAAPKGAPAGPPPPPAAGVEDLGGGFWLITGGYASVVAGFKKYIVVIEGPQSEARAEQIIAEAHRLIPTKPIKYVINTHTHFDHSAGLRAFVAEGATIVTLQGNKGFYEKAFANPHTLAPDRLSKMKPQPKLHIEYVPDKKVMTDGTHVIEMHHIQGSTHDLYDMMVYLPKQRILIEADEYNVANQPTTAPVEKPNSYQVNLLANVERLKLNVERIIPIHLPNDGRKVPLSELRFMAGKP